ncbi:uncharacterized protein F5147DRAFT_767191 [Suillus discolor]|uniref:Uncharacterized protein n=1 Tax=Suillus discolor TaxID=1912936 RepID=A0A9P7K002_9AGAM|nr:uncharacterized protein F5147DRAFT_767191 [Suillus discolor]KAG2119717.1 hypothetical protein F5147DRAFT_767191 [Suillus discolor]
MLFRRRRPTFVDPSHKYPLIHTKPDRGTSVLDREWTYTHMCHSHCAHIAFGSLIHLEDSSSCHQFHIGRISEVVAQYKNVLIVNVTTFNHDARDPYNPPPVRLTLPTGIISLPKHLRFIRWCKKRTNRLPAYEIKPLMQSLKDLSQLFEGNESFENSRVDLGGAFLVRNSQDRYQDDLLRHVRNLDPLSDSSLTHTSLFSATS